MTNTSNLTYKELATPYFREVFDCIDEVMTQMHIPYYLIGVSALALEMLKNGIKPSRGTKDIDFAIMISSLRQFDEVVTQLQHMGFNKVKAPWTLYHSKYKVAIDLLPFGEVEENDTIHFNERYSDLHVLGFREVLESATTVAIEEKLVQIPPLCGMVILKLVAWSDRPEERDNDLSDILLIIRKYYELEAEWNDIMDNHFDLLPENGEFDRLAISARVIGRKSAHILHKSDSLKIRIMNLLEKNVENPATSAIAEEWARPNQWTLAYATQLLIEFRTGIEETLT
jgi:predicted nucleotidyltransferase